MRPRFQVVLFFIYGIVLFVWALYLAGFGHGSYLPLDLVGAPFLVPELQYGIFISPFQWGILAIMLRHSKLGPAVAIIFLILHYAVAGFALHSLLHPEDTDFAHLNGMLPGVSRWIDAQAIKLPSSSGGN